MQLFAYFVPAIQFNVLLLLINQALPSNLYEMARIFGALYLQNVPPWELPNDKNASSLFSAVSAQRQTLPPRLARLDLQSNFLDNLDKCVLQIAVLWCIFLAVRHAHLRYSKN